MLKKKDNLTDVVENLPKEIPVISSDAPLKDQQVINSEGEVVTLGQDIAERVLKVVKKYKE